jgi:hypothetical protein
LTEEQQAKIREWRKRRTDAVESREPKRSNSGELNEHPKRGVSSVMTTNEDDYDEKAATKPKANESHEDEDDFTTVSTNVMQVTTQVTNAWQTIPPLSKPQWGATIHGGNLTWNHSDGQAQFGRNAYKKVPTSGVQDPNKSSDKPGTRPNRRECPGTNYNQFY